MWTIPQLKTRAKALLHKHYWGFVLASIILSMTGGRIMEPRKVMDAWEKYKEHQKEESVEDAGSTYPAAVVRPSAIVESPSKKRLLRRYEERMSRAEPLPVWLVAALWLFFLLVFALVLAFYLCVFVPLRLGTVRYFLVAQYRKPGWDELGVCFRKENYKNAIQVEFLRGLRVTLWSLLFLIPGIVKAYEYRMIPYLVAERPTIPPEEAFRLSKRMMTGEKARALLLDWSFWGWHLLGVITGGLLHLFYLYSYIDLTNAGLYVALRDGASRDSEANGF